jgi:hypothetical protein
MDDLTITPFNGPGVVMVPGELPPANYPSARVPSVLE